MALYVSSRGVATIQSQIQEEILGPIDEDWKECFNSDGDVYFMNSKTGEVQWERLVIKKT